MKEVRNYSNLFLANGLLSDASLKSYILHFACCILHYLLKSIPIKWVCALNGFSPSLGWSFS